MKRIRFLTALFIMFSLGLFFSPLVNSVMALACTMEPQPLQILKDTEQITVRGVDYNNVKEVRFICSRHSLFPIGWFTQTYNKSQLTPLPGNIGFTFTWNNHLGSAPCLRTNFTALPALDVYGLNDNVICNIRNISIEGGYPGTSCRISLDPNPPKPDEKYNVIITNLPANSNLGLDLNYWFDAAHHVVANNIQEGVPIELKAESIGQGITLRVFGVVNGETYTPLNPICSADYIVGELGIPGDGTTGKPNITDICNYVPGDANDTNTPRGKCIQCFKQEGIFTPFGCIETNPQQFVERILQIAIGVAGGIAFLMIIYGGFVTMTSAGNPERLTSGKEIITSAIAGLLLIIFSIIILRIIGVDILQLPGLK